MGDKELASGTSSGEGGVTSLVLPTPIRAGQLSTWLGGFHEANRGTLVRGFQVGFDVGYDGPHRVTRCANLKSALELPYIIDNKIKKRTNATTHCRPLHVTTLSTFAHFSSGSGSKEATWLI